MIRRKNQNIKINDRTRYKQPPNKADTISNREKFLETFDSFLIEMSGGYILLC